MLFFGIALRLLGFCFALSTVVVACSWDNPIWLKDRLSKTPLFRFVMDGKAGYIDNKGKIVIPPSFNAADNSGYDDFYDDIAAPHMLSTKRIDINGKPVLLGANGVPGYLHFSEGLIPTPVKLGAITKFGFSDRSGNLRVKPRFESLGNLSEGLAPARIGTKWGYVDSAGKIVVEPQYNLAEPFSEGVARVIVDGPCYYIGYGHCDNANPQIIGAGEYKRGRPGYKTCQYTFIDRRGVPIFPQKFRDAFDFTEGLAAVGDGRRWGFITKGGTLRIPLTFEAVGSFRDGLAKFRHNQKWGYMNALGRVVVPAQFDYADDFSSGAAAVGTLREKMWFIDIAGVKLFDRDFKLAGGFRLGLAHVSDGRQFHYIDRSGKIVFTYQPTTR